MATILAIKNNGDSFEFPEQNLANVRRLHSADIKEFILEGTDRWNEFNGIKPTKEETLTNTEVEEKEPTKRGRKAVTN